MFSFVAKLHDTLVLWIFSDWMFSGVLAWTHWVSSWLVNIITPIKLGSSSSPTNPLNNQGPFFDYSHCSVEHLEKTSPSLGLTES